MSKFDGKSSKVNQVIFFSAQTSIPNMKAVAQILFEISCTQDFQILFSKGHNSEKGQNSDMEKKIRVNYFFMRNLYIKFQIPSMRRSKVSIFTESRKFVRLQNFKILYFCQNLTKSSQKLIRSSTSQLQPVYQI